MKNSLKVCWIVSCSIISVIFLISACSQFVPPAVFSYIIFFSVAFPYLFVAMVILAIIGIFIDRKTGFILFVPLLLGLYNLSLTIAVSPHSAWKHAKDNSTLRVLTWNVAGFDNAHPLSTPEGKIRKGMLQMITSYNPDVLCLQEYQIFIGS